MPKRAGSWPRFGLMGQANFVRRSPGHLRWRRSLSFSDLSTPARPRLLDWYTGIADAILALTTGQPIADGSAASIADLRDSVENTILDGSDAGLLRRVHAAGELETHEVVSAAAVMMFGAIETAEGMTANALWYLLSEDGIVERVRQDRTLVPALIDESLRLEPAATFIDRYATATTRLGSVMIPHGDLVTVSLLAANRDPAVFATPDRFDLDRSNASQHVSFVQGPHRCIGAHLARLETRCAINAVLDAFDGLRWDREASQAPTGLIFRKPHAIAATWKKTDV